jgi:hypothetical protein
MKKQLLAGAVLGVAALASASVRAESYCQFWGPPMFDGDTVERSWRVVLGSVPREEIPGKPDRTWCRVNIAYGGRGLRGNFKSYEVLEAPKNGQFRSFPWSIVYKGMKVGHDRLVIKVEWLHPFNNQPMSATENIDIEVVDHAF